MMRLQQFNENPSQNEKLAYEWKSPWWKLIIEMKIYDEDENLLKDEINHPNENSNLMNIHHQDETRTKLRS